MYLLLLRANLAQRTALTTLDPSKYYAKHLNECTHLQKGSHRRTDVCRCGCKVLLAGFSGCVSSSGHKMLDSQGAKQIALGS